MSPPCYYRDGVAHCAQPAPLARLRQDAVSGIVVVGGGLAGLRSVMALRAYAYPGPITLIGAEPHRPYDRPPLSKTVLASAWSEEVDPPTLEADWDALDVQLRLGCRAVRLRDEVVDTEEGSLDFDSLVIATGASPWLPAELVSDPGGIYALRTIEDAQALRAAFSPAARIVIVGAGWIGSEVTTAAAAAGCQVTVVEAGKAPLAAALPAEVGACTLPWYAEAGVTPRLNSPVKMVAPDGVLLADGDWLPADAVVAGMGVRPQTEWLIGSEVALDASGAVLVDARLRTSAPGVFAVGDCAAWLSVRYGTRLRVEHWDNALRAPDVAAKNLLGAEARYDPVPYFWSEQFGRMLQYVGYHPVADAMIWRGDPTARQWAVCWLRGNRLIAVFAVNTPRDVLQARRLMAQNVAVDSNQLADPAVPIASCAL